MRFLATTLLLGAGVFFVSTAAAAQTYAEQCEPLIYEAEQRYNIPPGLLMAVAITESGRNDTPNPHAMNIAGYAYHAPNVEVMADVMARNLAAGRRSVDVGCMQINLKYHAQNFRNPYDLLNSRVNVDYGARYLVNLAVSTRSWRDAVMSYHNRKNPARRAGYGCSVWNNYLKIHRSATGYLACKTIRGATAAIRTQPATRQQMSAVTSSAPVWSASSEPLLAPRSNLVFASWQPDAAPTGHLAESQPDLQTPALPNQGDQAAVDTAAETASDAAPAQSDTISPTVDEPAASDASAASELVEIPQPQVDASASTPLPAESGYFSQPRGTKTVRGSIAIVAESESMPDIVQDDPKAGAFTSVKPLDWTARQKKVKAEASSPPEATQPDEIPLDSGFGRVTRKPD